MKRWTSSGGSRRLLAAFVCTAALAGLLGYAGARLVRSPAQVIADADSPGRSRLTAVVRSGALTSTIHARGQVALGTTTTVSVPSASGKVLTSPAPRTGKRLVDGTVLAELNDRPVLVLRGAYPLYRDLRPGDRGADVGRLQEALRAAGYSVSADGVFGDSTSDALRRLYTDRDFEVPMSTPEESEDEGEDNSPAGAGRAAGASDVPSAERASTPRPVVTALESELLMSPVLPARLVNSTFKQGETLTDATVSVVAGSPTIRVQLNPVDASALKRGQRANFEVVGGPSGTGTVTWIGPAVEVEGKGALCTVQVRPRRPLRFVSGGKEAIVTASSNDSSQGLVVPLSAVYTSPSGASFVRRVSPAGKEQKIEVTVLAQGETGIQVSSTKLASGDTVVVGIS